jgi:hypothetical protein
VLPSGRSADGSRRVRVQPSADGSYWRLLVAGGDGADERLLLGVPGPLGDPAFHPDGRRIVFCADVGPDRNRDLFLINDDGTDLVRLTRHPAVDADPSFTPDGRRLVWTSSRWDGTPRLTAAGFSDPQPVAGRSETGADGVRRHVDVLAGEDAEGRLTGSLGGAFAASYVAGCFRRFGLEPGGDGHAYRQGFEYTADIRRGPGNSLSVRVGDDVIEARIDEDFKPLRFTRNGTAEADAVAVGYGIVLPDGKEDDYAGWEVAGRTAVALEGAPEGWGGKHPDQRSLASNRKKAAAAAEKKAAALLLVGDLKKDAGDRGGGPESAPLPVIRVAKAFWDRVLARAGKADVKLRVSLRTEMTPVRRWAENVIGVWPGEGPEAVVVGAHYDHIGYGGRGLSAANVADRVHPGADDNASGVAGLLEIARIVAADGRRHRRAIVFAAWTGEELGFLGSSHYVAHPAVPLDRTAALVNLDMIGRAGANGLKLMGTGTSPFWDAWVSRVTAEAGVKVSVTPGGVRASDHAVFYARNIPVLFLFTGMIKEYHRPTDTADREDAPGIVEVARWARLAAEAAADADPRPVFTPLKEGGPPTRAYLGISPDNAAESDGVHVNAVVPGGPAEHAGIRVGDVIVRIRETPVQGIDDLHGVLAGLKPDEEVEVTLRRDGTTETVRVRLGRAPDER